MIYVQGIILGDTNTQIGKVAVHYPTTGQHSLQRHSNDNGQRLIHFAASREMINTNTLFCCKDV